MITDTLPDKSSISVNYGLVSIITPSYNSSKFICDMIESVLGQSYQNWELLITDDCSSDDTTDIIRNYCNKDDRIKLFILPSNFGAGIARNNSIAHATGRFIAFIDSDDIWLPNKLERQLSFMTKNGISVSYCSSLHCDENGEIFGINPAYKQVSFRQICNCDKCGTTEIIYDSSKLGKIMMPPLRKRQDWGFKINLLKKAGYAYGILETLTIYRIRHNSISRNKFRLIKYNVQVYRDVLNHNRIMAWSRFIILFMPFYIMKKLRYIITNSAI